ncbi:nucleoporin NDC1-like [Physella acuta]|uniref:nucleoporin NDC1-like n=1 Tax=Physella acuta TaxID=109671 RepID=UPI0027DDEB40|nr:nucleoporin NDC1-like [Physella acuta]
MSSAVHNWFNSEVFLWRNLASVFWSILKIPVVLIFFNFLSGLSITHPLEWLFGTFAVVLTSRFWLCALVNTACLVLVSRFTIPHFSVAADIDSSMLMSVLNLLRWKRLPLLVISSVSGAVSAWSLSGLIGPEYGSLTTVIEPETRLTVLNETHLFIVASGILAGICSFVFFFRDRQYFLAFPNVHRLKLFRVKNGTLQLFKTTSWLSLHVVKYFYILYCLFGEVPKMWITRSFNINNNPNVPEFSTFVGLFNPSLFWQTYLCTFFIIFMWSLARIMIRIYHTERIEFCVNNVLAEDADKNLADALSCKESSILQHLAFLDLNWLSKYSPSRRQELLSLSQPGGHPRAWVATSSAALQAVRELCDAIRDENTAVMSRVSVSAQKSVSNFSSSSYNPSAAGDSYSSTFLNTDGSVTPSSSDEDVKTPSPLMKWISSLGNLPFLSQLIAEYPDISSRRLFSYCQMHIWAVEALSQIASKSITEDKYGVVQTILPSLIRTLLDLYEAMEKHFKLTTSVLRRTNGVYDGPPDALLRFELHAINKAAIYRIVNSYQLHLEDLRIGQDYFRKLQPFIAYHA